MVIEDRKDEVKTSSGGDTPAPGAGLEGRSACSGSTTESMDEWDKASLLVAKDGTSLCGVVAIVGAVREEAAFGLDSNVAVEVGRGAGDCTGVNGLVDEGSDFTIEGMEISVSAIEIDA